jgi:ABC-type sugar transport system ATPase subunit
LSGLAPGNLPELPKEEEKKMSEATVVLKANNISKTFPGVKALDSVDIELRKGEVLALVGENGAGKSTLTKILSGLHTPDKGSGEIRLSGEVVHFQNSKEAKNSGLITIYQELSLVPELSVAENIFLGNLPRTKLGFIDWKELNSLAEGILQDIELDISPTEILGNLSISKQQMVEIARALSQGAKVIIFDEPTSSLTETEKDVLFKNIRKLKSKDVAIVYISHKMDEVFELTDRIAVLRGRPEQRRTRHEGRIAGRRHPADDRSGDRRLLP